jgi:TonB family protein
MRRARLAAGAALLALAGVRAAGAQVVGGRIVDSASRRPLPDVSVRLVRVHASDTSVLPADTTPLARATSAGDGVFTFAAPDTGTFRVRVGEQFVGPPLALRSRDTFDQHEYLVTPVVEPTFTVAQVERQAWAKPGSIARGLRYPASLQAANVEGKVDVQFVVDTTGRAIVGTLRVLRTTHPDFVDPVRTAVYGAEYSPAEVGGRKVRQLVQMPVAFTLVYQSATPSPGPPPRTSRRTSPGP